MEISDVIYNKSTDFATEVSVPPTDLIKSFYYNSTFSVVFQFNKGLQELLLYLR